MRTREEEDEGDFFLLFSTFERCFLDLFKQVKELLSRIAKMMVVREP